MLPLGIRLSKAQVIAIANNLHHDECGIEAMFTTMKQADNPRVAYNAAWVLSLLSKEDKKIYLLPYYGELVDMATSAELCFRRGLILTILADLPANELNSNLLDFCLIHMIDPKESDGSRSAMIKLAARMCKPYPELCKVVFGYDAARFIAKHSGSKKERLKNNSKRIWNYRIGSKDLRKAYSCFHQNNGLLSFQNVEKIV